jgi:hypothetical protein
MYQYAIDSPYRINSDYAKKLIQDNKIDLILDVRTNLELFRFIFADAIPSKNLLGRWDITGRLISLLRHIMIS